MHCTQGIVGACPFTRIASTCACCGGGPTTTGSSFSIDGGVVGVDHPKLYDLISKVHPATQSKL
jgi:hypothetical protein